MYNTNQTFEFCISTLSEKNYLCQRGFGTKMLKAVQLKSQKADLRVVQKAAAAHRHDGEQYSVATSRPFFKGPKVLTQYVK